MHGLALDLRHALRSLARNPAFAATAIVAVALGIGASTATFSVIDSVALKPLPWPEPDRIVSLNQVIPELPESETRGGFLLNNIREWRERGQAIESIGAYMNELTTYTGGDQPIRLQAARVTPGFFRVLRATPRLGRAFEQADVDRGETKVAVLSSSAFERLVASDPTRIGTPLRLDGELFTLLGVLPAGFDFPNRDTQVWLPLVFQESTDPNEEREISLPAIARLAGGFSIAQAEDEGNRLLQALQAEREERHEQQRAAAAAAAGEAGEGEQSAGGRRERRHQGGQDRSATTLRMRSLQQQQIAPFRPAMRALSVAVALVFLIACANVANLLLTRGVHRQRELATRAALGAGRRGLVRALLAEGLVIAVIGSLAGLMLAVAAVRLVVRLDPGDIPRLAEVTLRPQALLFAVALTILAALLFGLAPLLQLSFSQLGSMLGREGGPVAGRRSLQSVLRGSLAVGEIALALVLLIGAGLLSTSFLKLTDVDTGFEPEGVLTAYVAAPTATYPPGPARTSFFDSYLERLRALPGVERVGLVNFLPPVQGRIVLSFLVEGKPRPNDPREIPTADLRVVSPGYFEAMGIPVLQGRSFADTDRGDAPPVIVINNTMAKMYFSEEEPVGERLANFGEIVGVIGDVRASGYDSQPQPTFYVLMAQAPPMMAPLFDRMAVVVRATQPNRLAGALRSELANLDANLALDDVATMESRMADSVALPRFYASVMAVFAALALALALVGIYGVMSYSVSQRARETGLRMALGAQRRQVIGHTLGRGFAITALGVILGLAGALGLNRLVASLLYETEPTDPATLSALTAALLATALLACWLPARRAARVDPVVALRDE